MSFIKICDKFIRPTTVFCGTDFLYQTQHEIQITAGSGSMNESLIDTVACLCSIAVCLCFPLFHSVHICPVVCVYNCHVLKHVLKQWTVQISSISTCDWYWYAFYDFCTLLVFRSTAVVMCMYNENTHIYVLIRGLYVCKYICHVVYMQGVSWSFSALK